MMGSGENQSVLISGESGAGKTEATKQVLKYMSVVAAQQTVHDEMGDEGAVPQGIEEQILASNPILESFGNAKTSRNNNSSRFGKWMELDMDSNGSIKGAKIVNYLLEKVRVVRQNKGERNYHVPVVLFFPPRK